jgi:hypothetical protein
VLYSQSFSRGNPTSSLRQQPAPDGAHISGTKVCNGLQHAHRNNQQQQRTVLLAAYIELDSWLGCLLRDGAAGASAV